MDVALDPVLISLKGRMKPETWQRRLSKAAEKVEALEAIARLRAEGLTEAEALSKAGPGIASSTYRLWRQKNEQGGLVDLISRRPAGTGPQKLTPVIRQVIAALRRADPQIGVEQIAVVVRAQFDVGLSGTLIKQVLKEVGLNRPSGGGSRHEPVAEELLFAGAAFFQIGELELGCSAGLAETIFELAHEAPAPDPDVELRDERTGRDEHGHFTAAYNQTHLKGEAKLGPAFRSVEETRRETDLRERKLAHEQLETLQRKVQACLALAMLTEAGRTVQLDDYRGGWGIAEFCGIRYSGTTLDRFRLSSTWCG